MRSRKSPIRQRFSDSLNHSTDQLEPIPHYLLIHPDISSDAQIRYPFGQIVVDATVIMRNAVAQCTEVTQCIPVLVGENLGLYADAM